MAATPATAPLLTCIRLCLGEREEREREGEKERKRERERERERGGEVGREREREDRYHRCAPPARAALAAAGRECTPPRADHARKP